VYIYDCAAYGGETCDYFAKWDIVNCTGSALSGDSCPLGHECDWAMTDSCATAGGSKYCTTYCQNKSDCADATPCCVKFNDEIWRCVKKDNLNPQYWDTYCKE